jgi:hypothetical protein
LAVGKDWTPRKQTVELEGVAPPPSKIRRASAPPPGSRIRRDPVPENRPLPGILGRIDWNSREMEIALAIGGIVLFALAIDAISIGISVVYK